MIECDPVTGTCRLPDPVPSALPPPRPVHRRRAVHYVGDPMCSWCWGISPAVRELAAFCAAERIEFSITMGGLRAGGGDPWNARFKAFLRNEWSHIAAATGQPFGFTLLDAPDFDYDTEPACRAVTTVQLLLAGDPLAESTALEFFAETQRRFYVEGQDPKRVDFYAAPCARTGVDFDRFAVLFDSAAARQATQDAFLRCRQWGVRSFPTLLCERDGERVVLASGFVTAAELVSRLRRLLES